MKPLPSSHLRIARPSRDLRAAERFWVGGLGLEVLFRADSSAEGGHALLMVGWPDAAWHLELVEDPGAAAPAAPTEEDLLVLYLDGEVDADVVGRLVVAGGTQAASRNPYWDHEGVTIVDPDGYRLVLTSRPCRACPVRAVAPAQPRRRSAPPHRPDDRAGREPGR